jgi:hypothetical protein
MVNISRFLHDDRCFHLGHMLESYATHADMCLKSDECIATCTTKHGSRRGTSIEPLVDILDGRWTADGMHDGYDRRPRATTLRMGYIATTTSLSGEYVHEDGDQDEHLLREGNLRQRSD